MSDRELIELAAKAVGYEIISHAYDGFIYIKGQEDEWSPLHDDSDAFRLAVKVGLRIDQMHLDGPSVMVGNGDVWIIEHYNGDRYAATRRAITRAAAEIGRGMV